MTSRREALRYVLGAAAAPLLSGSKGVSGLLTTAYKGSMWPAMPDEPPENVEIPGGAVGMGYQDSKSRMWSRMGERVYRRWENHLQHTNVMGGRSGYCHVLATCMLCLQYDFAENVPEREGPIWGKVCNTC